MTFKNNSTDHGLLVILTKDEKWSKWLTKTPRSLFLHFPKHEGCCNCYAIIFSNRQTMSVKYNNLIRIYTLKTIVLIVCCVSYWLLSTFKFEFLDHILTHDFLLREMLSNRLSMALLVSYDYSLFLNSFSTSDKPEKLEKKQKWF